jgi:hypothetical protein
LAAVIELFVLGVLGLVALAVCGLFVAGLSLVMWVVFLPFRILGFLFRGLGLVLALPFMLIFGILGLVIFGLGGLLFLVPFAPLALIAFLIWRWMRGRPRAVSA